MKALFVALCMSLAIGAAQQPIDDLNIVVDPKADLSQFRTFAIRVGKIASDRGGGRGTGPQPLRFTVGMLVIDLIRPGSPAPVWRGVYRDTESTGSKLMQKLPEDAKKLIAKFPAR